MVISNTEHKYDKESELKAFDDTKAGVKGLVDSGITKVPRIFIHPEALEISSTSKKSHFIFPLIDLKDINKDHVMHKEAVSKIEDASERWGFFQVINHGIPVSVLDEIQRGARRFFEQDVSVKKPYYNRDVTKSVNHNCNFDLFSAKALAANWRDSLYCKMAPIPAKPEELPEVCREIIIEYSDHVMKLGYTLLELWSEALGLKPSHLKEMGCADGLGILCNYYPACPQPEVAIGTSRHSDNGFFTVLLQDNVGGLQVFHQDQWVDVPPTHGTLIINIGDLLQLISNDKYKSIDHRVLANRVGPRISVASFFGIGPLPSQKLFGPIEELLSDENPQKYRATTIKDFFEYSSNKGLDGNSNLSHYRI